MSCQLVYINECALNFLPGIYMFKVNYENTRTMCRMWAKLTIKITERDAIGVTLVSLLLI